MGVPLCIFHNHGLGKDGKRVGCMQTAALASVLLAVAFRKAHEVQVL